MAPDGGVVRLEAKTALTKELRVRKKRIMTKEVSSNFEKIP
jgi:hypothetical protein